MPRYFQILADVSLGRPCSGEEMLKLISGSAAWDLTPQEVLDRVHAIVADRIGQRVREYQHTDGMITHEGRGRIADYVIQEGNPRPLPTELHLTWGGIVVRARTYDEALCMAAEYDLRREMAELPEARWF